MADLFTRKLTPLSFQDVDEFLGLSLPTDKRLPESSRIDYKQDLPGDLGDDVAALANTYGGLIFLGIKSDRNQNNIPVQWDGVQLGSLVALCPPFSCHGSPPLTTWETGKTPRTRP